MNETADLLVAFAGLICFPLSLIVGILVFFRSINKGMYSAKTQAVRRVLVMLGIILSVRHMEMNKFYSLYEVIKNKLQAWRCSSCSTWNQSQTKSCVGCETSK